jgi:P-type Cu+ transporter
MKDSARDPVCGMEVDTRQGKKQRHQGEDFYFCSDECRRKFSVDPVAYTTSHP